MLNHWQSFYFQHYGPDYTSAVALKIVISLSQRNKSVVSTHGNEWIVFLKYFYNDHLRQKTQYTQFMRKAPIIREFEKICVQNELKFQLKSH